jgi:F-type H+-transporting ATPase subunit delta
VALEGSIARRYARALIAIGIDKGDYEALAKELAEVAGLIARSKELRDVLERPLFALSKRKAILEEVSRKLTLSETLRRFLQLLLDRGRFGNLAGIVREMGVLVDRQAGRVRATLIAARPVSDAFAQSIQQSIEAREGKKVVLERRDDPALIGGVVAQVGDVVYDGSVRTQLELAKQQFLTE